MIEKIRGLLPKRTVIVVAAILFVAVLGIITSAVIANNRTAFENDRLKKDNKNKEILIEVQKEQITELERQMDNAEKELDQLFAQISHNRTQEGWALSQLGFTSNVVENYNEYNTVLDEQLKVIGEIKAESVVNLEKGQEISRSLMEYIEIEEERINAEKAENDKNIRILKEEQRKMEELQKEISSKLKELQDEYDEMDRQIKRLKNEANELRAANVRLENIVEELQDEVDGLLDTQTGLIVKRDDAAAANDAIKAQISILEKRLEDFENQVATYEKQIASLKAQIENGNDENENLKTLLKILEDDKAAIEQKISDALKEKKKLEDEEKQLERN